MIKLAPGVSLYSLKPQALLALFLVDQVFQEKVDRTVVTLVSSANDRKHGTGALPHQVRHPPAALPNEPLPVLFGSYHYEGLAFDIDWDPLLRVSDGVRRELALEIGARLGDEFDVIAEDLGTGNSHLHVEWDRRRVEKARAVAGLGIGGW